ncbi:MAG: hypothetical protein JNL79_06770 [Myxococcales bacterium]|nr:hypothetical protein [Myxococcales bacterium]
MSVASDRPPSPASSSNSEVPSGEITPVSSVRRHGEIRSRQFVLHRRFAAQRFGLEGLGVPPELLATELPEWVPCGWVTMLVEALFEGPMRRDPETLHRHAEAIMEEGFVRDRAALFEVATLSMMLRHAGPLWRDELSSGRLVGFSTETEGTLVLHDHPWTESAAMRAFLGRAIQHGLAKLRPGTTVSFDPEPQKTLAMEIRF